jgi:hypothetical protein
MDIKTEIENYVIRNDEVTTALIARVGVERAKKIRLIASMSYYNEFCAKGLSKLLFESIYTQTFEQMVDTENEKETQEFTDDVKAYIRTLQNIAPNL